MTKYVIKRILLVFLTAFIVLSLTYILLCCLKVDLPFFTSEGQKVAYLTNQWQKGFLVRETMPTEKYGELFGSYTIGSGVSQVTYYYYQRPIMDRYFSFLQGVFTRWDWGTSIGFEVGRPTIDILMSRLPTTILINVISVIFSVPLGIGLGIWCALKKDSVFDNVMQVLMMVVISIPSFVLISYLIMMAANISWIPTFWPQSTDPLYLRVGAFVVPVLALSLGSIFGYARFVRAELCEVLESDYLLLARTKGLTRRQSILRHALRNSMVPVLPMVVSEFISILGGSMILENLYQIPGVGQLYMAAFNAKDYSLLMTDMAFYTLIGLLAAIVVDLSYGFIDPRIRMGAKK